MENILNTELARLIDLLSALQDKKSFNAYLEKIKNHNTLSYAELKYYLEQIQEIILSYDDHYIWSEELSAISKCLLLQDEIEREKNKKIKELEPLKKFWNSFKLWTERELPYLKILKDYHIRYDNWDNGTYYLDIDMPMEFTKAYGVNYDGQFDKEYISVSDLKMFIELFYNEFVENRYEYTINVNKYFSKFSIPYKLANGKLTKKGYKSTNENTRILNYQMLERKIIWSEEKILGSEKLDKHTALNYITDSLQYILSLIKNECTKGKQIEQKCANLIAKETSKMYSVVKTEVEEIQKIVNEYFDIRHNEYISSSKKVREPINDNVFIEYLYNRIYALLFLLKVSYSKNLPEENYNQKNENDLPF